MDWLVLKTFLSLVLIVALMFGFLFVVRKYLLGSRTPSQIGNLGADNLKVLTSLHLQPKKAVYLVKVFNKVMLVGVSDNSIAALGEITDSEALQKLEAAESTRHGGRFAEILKSISVR